MNAVEQRFMGALDTSAADQRDMAPLLTSMNDWLGALVQALDGARLAHDGLLPDSALAPKVRDINAGVALAQAYWAGQWQVLGQARALAQRFEGRVILLVFGKFNAGKSSLCNFLAGRFALHGHGVHYFQVGDGQVRPLEEGFREGATETTARLQGVCLGERLVLLDTPGLHSATDDNAALAQRFLESADAVLWLTSSTSPGQVQELDELAQELRRGKPLLPIITRSDCIEEDEVDGELVKCLCNKSGANRALQQADVHARAQAKLRSLEVEVAQLRAPVSISAHMAQTDPRPALALADAGFEHLYEALQKIIAPALAYRQRKPAEILLHHLQENVIGRLRTTTVAQAEDLRRAVQDETDALAPRQARIIQMAWRDVVSELPQVLESYAPGRDVDAACAEIARIAGTAFERHARENLPGYTLPPTPVMSIDLPAGTGYEPALPGAADDGVSVGYEKLYAVLTNVIHELLTRHGGEVMMACEESLLALATCAEALQDLVSSYSARLHDLSEALRTGTGDRLALFGT
jgi:hypothetical protein